MFVALVLIVLGGAPTEARKKSFDDFCSEVIATFEAFYPVQASRVGLHSFDSRLADYSRKSVKSLVSKLKDHYKTLRSYKETSLDDRQRINHRLIASSLDMALLDLDKIKWHKRLPHMYVDEAVNGLRTLMTSQHRPLTERVYPLLDRMKAVPGVLETARENITSAPNVHIQAARERVKAALDVFAATAAELMNALPEKADDILKVSTRAREALTEYDVFLAELKTDEGEALPIGKQNLEYILTHGLMLDYGADSLLAECEAIFGQLTEEYDDFVEYVENHHQNGSDSVFVPASFSRDDILDYYAWELQQMRLSVESRDLARIPTDDLHIEVLETPPYLRPLMSQSGYEPLAPFDSTSTARLYVRPLAADLDPAQLAARYRYVHRRGFRDRVVSEVFPGRHLQLLALKESDDPVRKWYRSDAATEGWAMYCREAGYELGMFGPDNPGQWLTVLRDKQLTAARAVAEIRLHLGEWTVDQCVAWIVDAMNAESASISEYVREAAVRSTYRPATAVSALLGCMEYGRLRDVAEKEAGEDFDASGFHDAILKEGAIPPVLLRGMIEAP
jgi:uncharacterized protein (DUF885 family)